MDWLLAFQLATKFGPAIAQIVQTGLSNEDIATKLKAEAAPVAHVLEEVGAQFFPKSAPALHIVAGAIAAFDMNTTKWMQGALNNLLTPSPNLAVDGSYGAKTKAAVEQLQTKLGLKVDGVAGKITQAAISAALAAKR